MINTYYVVNFMLTTTVVAAFAGALYYFYYYKPRHLATTTSVATVVVDSTKPLAEDTKKHTVLFDVLIVLLVVVLVFMSGLKARQLIKRRKNNNIVAVPKSETGVVVGFDWDKMKKELSKSIIGSKEWNEIVEKGNTQDRNKTSQIVTEFNERRRAIKEELIKAEIKAAQPLLGPFDKFIKTTNETAALLKEVSLSTTDEGIEVQKIWFKGSLLTIFDIGGEEEFQKAVKSLSVKEKEWFEESKAEIEYMKMNHTERGKNWRISMISQLKQLAWKAETMPASAVKYDELKKALQARATELKLPSVEELFEWKDHKNVIREHFN